MFYMNSKGEIYTGDVQPGDREATSDEITACFGSPLENARKGKLAEIMTDFNDEMSETGRVSVAELDGFEVDARRRDIQNIQGLIDVYEGPVSFFGYSDFRHGTTLEELEIIKKAIIHKGQDLYARKWMLEQQVKNATTVEEVEALTW